MRSVAEGVETAANLAAVRSAGYDEAQGFYFSPPVPASAIERAISQCALRLSGPGTGAPPAKGGKAPAKKRTRT
jgi:predicted signal transduction protein with EAL and GGDEF domain